MSQDRSSELAACNQEALKFAKSFQNAELIGFMHQAIEHKFHGTLYHTPIKSGRPRCECEFIFVDGCCLRAIEPIRGEANTFNKSIKFEKKRTK